MSLISWAESKTRKLSIWDFGFVKLYCFLMGAIVGSYLVGFVRDNVVAIAAVIVVLIAYLMYRVFSK